MLKIENINTFYGSSHVLHGVSMEVHQGEIVVLLGRNGVGKTTTLKSIMGIVPPRSGRVMFDGEDITGRPPHRVAILGVAFIPEERRIFPNLTVLENLRMGMVASRSPIDRKARIAAAFDYFPRLRERINNKGDRLSGGEQQMLTIARGLVSNPRLLMIDEPTEGLSPILVDEITRIIQRLHKDGVTILIVEQNYQMSLSLSENLRAYVIEKGQIKFGGSPSELRACQVDVEKCLGVKI
jgi:branched-chain amino acid transport system ATP-binding protein